MQAAAIGCRGMSESLVGMRRYRKMGLTLMISMGPCLDGIIP